MVIPEENITCNISDLKGAGDTFKWNFNFNNSNLSSYSGYGYNNSWTKRCPEEGSIQVEKVDKSWKITIKFKDSIDKDFGSPEGTNNTLVVEWEGPATKYSGTKPNDLTDEDY